MPAQGVLNTQWLAGNELRRYPLADDATGVDDSGSFTIPDDLLVELYLPIHAGMDVDPARFFVRNIGAYTTGYSVIIGYQPADGDPINVASALIPRSGFVRHRPYVLGGIDPFDDTLGRVVLGKFDNADQQPPGFWSFTLETGRLDPDAVRPIIRGVTSLICVNGEQESVKLQGDITFVAGQNMRIDAIVVDGEDPIIRFNAISGEGTISDCVCSGDTEPTEPIKAINGIFPTADGDFTLLNGACIQFEAIANGIKMTDTCASPCCGCPELARINEDLLHLEQEAEGVRRFVDQLSEAQNTMSLTVLGARLGRNCVTC